MKMEINVVEEKKNRFVFEVKGAGHGLCNALKHELSQDSHVKNATYTIEHPLINVPKFIVETDGAEPKKAVMAAAQKLGKQADKLKSIVSSDLK